MALGSLIYIDSRSRTLCHPSPSPRPQSVIENFQYICATLLLLLYLLYADGCFSLSNGAVPLAEAVEC